MPAPKRIPKREPISKQREETPEEIDETPDEVEEEPEEGSEDQDTNDGDSAVSDDSGAAGDTNQEDQEPPALRDIGQTHKALDEKLHEIQNTAQVQHDMTQDEEEISDFGALPNAPKGEVIVLGPDEPLRVSGEVQGNVIVLDKAVYRAKRPFRSLRWTFQLMYPAGHTVPTHVARRMEEPKGTEPQSTEETK